jgi:hypothetical protein
LEEIDIRMEMPLLLVTAVKVEVVEVERLDLIMPVLVVQEQPDLF